MKLQALIAFTAANTAFAHTIFSNLHVNGIDQGEGVGVRYRRKTQSNYPLEDLASPDMACNVGGDTGVPEVLSVPMGANLTFEFKASLIDKSKPRLEPGHKGPCAVYLKKVEDASKDQGSGEGWFKIFEEGWDGQVWCTTRLTSTGMLSVVLPEGLAAGEYLARPELLALHNALEGDPQFFVSCMQIRVEGNGSLSPASDSLVSIPGYIDKDDEGVTFNIYSGDQSTYKIPGPEVVKLAGGSGNGDAGAEKNNDTPTSSTTAGAPGITKAPECAPTATVTEKVTEKETITVFADRRRDAHARRHGLWVREG